MKKLLILFLFLGLAACVAPHRIADLERQVAELKGAGKPSPMLLAEQAGARKFWWRNNLDADANSLSSILVGSLTDGDAAIVAYKDGETMSLYFYIFDDDADDAQSLPTIVEPNAGAGAWFLATIQGVGFTGNTADGFHFINASNTGNIDNSLLTQGNCYYNKGTDKLMCVDVSGVTQVIGP